MIEELNDQVNSLVAEVEEYQKRTEDLEHELERLKRELIIKHNA